MGPSLGKEKTSKEPVWSETTQEVPGVPLDLQSAIWVYPPFKILRKSHNCTVSHTTMTPHKRCLHYWLVDFQPNLHTVHTNISVLNTGNVVLQEYLESRILYALKCIPPLLMFTWSTSQPTR